MRFKHNIIIGGVDGKDIDGLVKGVLEQATSGSFSAQATRIVLEQVLLKLNQQFPRRESIFELCEPPGPQNPPKGERPREFA